MRRWAMLGLVGLLFVLYAVPAYEAWAINLAGVSVNRALAAGLSDDPAAPSTQAEAPPSRVADGLDTAKELMRDAASHGPFTHDRQSRLWRTFGAAAMLAPNDEDFELLRAASHLGRLDRTGELWLGKVAAATGHWEEATEAYRRVDASNILISDGDTYLKAGDNELAASRYRLARISLEAAMEREAAESLLHGETAEDDSLTAALMTSASERVTALYRIGKGLLVAGEASEALPVLEEALDRASDASPGAVIEQSLRLHLGLALARTLPLPPDSFATDHVSYFPEQEAIGYLQLTARIRGLVYGSIESDRTAPVCVQAARALLILGDEEQAVALLDEAIELDPLISEAYLLLGDWYERKGMKLLPLQLYADAREQMPSDERLAVAHALAAYEVLAAQEALPILQEAAATPTDDAGLFAALGDCYRELGSTVEAREAYEEGLRRAPSSEQLVDRLHDLEAGVGGAR